MPRPAMPLTPADSAKIGGKENTLMLSSEPAFKLPSPTITQKGNDKIGSPSHRAIQPAVSSGLSLPPPPTRSRKIIHMTPKPLACDPDKEMPEMSVKGNGRTARANSRATATKKQPSASSASGKKIARKTAHSVIERRRRSKMNEEFGTLKDMIPACKGQEMHKLAILQASIDYLRYLERCIGDLKTANNALSTPLLHARAPKLRQHGGSLSEDEQETCGSGQEDEPMQEANATLESTPPARSRLPTPWTSPQSPTNLTGPDLAETRHQALIESAPLPPPAYEAKQYRPRSHHSFSACSWTPTETSPTLLPDTEQDAEATAALLMLNRDRRYSTTQDKGKRGLSVKDLLSH